MCNLTSAGGDSGSTSIFRTFRLLRVLKLMRTIAPLRQLLQVVIQSLQRVASMALVFFLFVFVFAILGMQRTYSVPVTPASQVAARFAGSVGVCLGRSRLLHPTHRPPTFPLCHIGVLRPAPLVPSLVPV